MLIDTIGNFLTVIRNGLMVSKRSVSVPNSKLKQAIAKVLKDEGYIKDFKVTQDGVKSLLTVALKYSSGEAVIHELTRVSTPGRRYYEGVSNISQVIGGLGTSVLTTSRGIMTDKQAKKLGVGGEVICHVW